MAERTFDAIRMQRDDLRAWLETIKLCGPWVSLAPEMSRVHQRSIVEARKVANAMLETWKQSDPSTTEPTEK